MEDKAHPHEIQHSENELEGIPAVREEIELETNIKPELVNSNGNSDEVVKITSLEKIRICNSEACRKANAHSHDVMQFDPLYKQKICMFVSLIGLLIIWAFVHFTCFNK